MLRRIVGHKRDKVTGEWRKLHNEELNDLCSSPSIVQVIKLRRMIWAGHMMYGGRGEAYTGFWWGNVRERDHLEDAGIDGRIILGWIFRQWDVGVDWIELVQDRDRWRALVSVLMNLQVP